jgi:GT2 family glycosyltransferase
MSLPTVGAVILSQGTRPAELERALATLLAQEGVDLDVVLVGNGWEPVGLPAGVRTLHLPANVGIPEGRNVGAAEARGDLLFFYDDDCALPTTDVISRLVSVLEADPTIAVVQPRPVDPAGAPGQARWVPRPGSRGELRAGPVGWFWEGTFLVRREVFERAGGWPGHFWYGHEGVELAWRIWDLGYRTWYEPQVVTNHPSLPPTKHEVYYRLNARNRVWVARRNLPLPLAVVYVTAWTLLTVVRFRSVRTLRVWFAGFREGIGPGAGPRRPISWRTAWRLTRAGRPPVL